MTLYQDVDSTLVKGPVIGSGSFGKVFFGYWSGLPCAIKQISVPSETIEREVALFRNLRYKNIIQFYAALDHTAANDEKMLLIVMEYAENGTLTKAIQSKCLNREDKKRISNQMICGLAYMHFRQVLHRDLKSDNVLLTDGMKVAKLCDFGLAKLKPLGQTPEDNDGHVGTRRWMAPELFVANPEYTTKTDVYSLGWILWQMAADIPKPFMHLTEDEAIEQVKKGARGEIPDDTPSEIRGPIEGFWQDDAKLRPEAREFLDESTFPQGLDNAPTLEFSFGTSVDDDSGFQENEVQTVVTTADGNAMQNLTVHHQLQLHQQQPQSTRPALSSSSEASPPTEKPALKVVVRDFQRLALDNMYAQFAFGMMFLKSKGSIQSDFEALYWFKKAAELGHPEAQFYIGDLYERDRLLRKDVDRAIYWYGKAAAQNHAEAMRRLLILAPPKPTTPTHVDLELTEYLLGPSRHGQVRLAFWLGQPCAVKMKHAMRTDAEQKELHQEISILSKLKHPHIVHFLGDVKLDGMLVIVMEFAENGSLASLILESNPSLSGWPEKERIAQEIIRGVAYLHSLDILHCDLKSSNVLLDHSFRAKICDFGSSIVRGSEASMSSESHSRRGTVRWLAPELLTTSPKYSTKSDMYALGCIMWEMAANSTPPFKGLDQFIAAERVYSGKREEIPNDTPEEYRRWIEGCWSHDPASRPEAIDIVRHHVIPESFVPRNVCDLDDFSSNTDVPRFSAFTDANSSEEEYTDKPAADGHFESNQLWATAGNLIRAIKSVLPNMKFYRKTIHHLFNDCKSTSTIHGVNFGELINILQKIYPLTVQLSTSGVALLINIDDLSKDLTDIRERWKKLVPTPAAQASTSNNRKGFTIIQKMLKKRFLTPAFHASSSSNNSNSNSNKSNDNTAAPNVETIEREERDELAAVQAKLMRHRFSAYKLFDNYNIKPEDFRRFVLSKESLKYDVSKSIFSDDISKAYEGEIIQGPHRGEKVHVKYLEEIDGGSTKDIIQRTIFFTHLLSACQNILRPRFVVSPNLILFEPSTQLRLSEYPLAQSQKVDVALKIAGALALVHSFEVVHRDIRASNVIMSKQGDGDSAVIVPKLTGFEVCTHSRLHYSLGSVVQRTVWTVWHAPECISRHGTSFKTDVFSFGVLMYEISMGHPPEMRGNDVKHADVQDWISQEYDHVSEGYSELMRRCLEIDYPNRPLMPEVVEELIRVASWKL
ncbi:hypothetical protein DFQ27_009570 [Actinomortierella ambigua]|uniref:Protein kinase domain-containing protein n=1 Tax=Actinomortierella ambigua TaxID=1343610 RepID=A0A9P6PPQ2_9FUNG|nr:hypothetical protein DFQ27_009570 [Actinomortierella ambigua]